MRLHSVKPKNVKVALKGAFSLPIPYEIRNPSGDWSPYFGQYEGQKKGDLDTNCCWAFAGNEVLEDQLEFLMKTGRFNKEDIDWFKANGYIDEDGDFYLSRRFVPILSGVRDNGNDEAEFWRLTKDYGAIPNKVLPFTGMNNYFDKAAITESMYELGREFKKKVSVKSENLGKRFTRTDIKKIQGALYQGELQIGVPVPEYIQWNRQKVRWDGTSNAEHSIAFYKYDEIADYEYPYFIYDQYEPHLKQLSRDYFIPIITRAVINPVNPAVSNPVSQLSLGAKIWRAVMNYLGFPVQN